MNDEIKSLIERYRLEPHPEGGWYREVYCSGLQVESSMVAAQRPAMTHIYFLLGRGEYSRFHCLVHDELWHFYAGAPLQLYVFSGADVGVHILGPDTEPIGVIRGGEFQAAESSGVYTLMGCTVAPGFDFSDFSFLADHPEQRARLEELSPDHTRLI